jgi:toxin ParE1/3/4
VKIRWLRRAVQTLDAQLDYIAERNAAAAVRLGEALRVAVAMLADHPHMGRAGRVGGTRELVVARTPYIIIYRIMNQEVRILRVLYSAQRWPPTH